MGDLSPHFSRVEFDCHDGALAHPDPELIQRLETLRAEVSAAHSHDMPCYIVSGYRDAAYNRKIGGATDSQHVQNRAADLRAGYATIQQAEAAGFRGIGFNGGWAVHVDVRPGLGVIFEDR